MQANPATKNHRYLTQAFDAALKPVGLKATQLTVLAALSGTGDVPLTQLADALIMDRTTLTRNLKPLERDGLIRIEQEVDQRVRVIGLTDTGARLLEEARPLWEQAQSRFHETLGHTRWSNFLDDISATIAVVRDP